MLFNPDRNKQAIEVCFSHRGKKKNTPPLVFNSTNTQSAASQKHLGLILDSKLDFNDHIGNNINKCNKILTQSRKGLLTIHKAFCKT